jgi:hypothetical protein
LARRPSARRRFAFVCLLAAFATPALAQDDKDLEPRLLAVKPPPVADGRFWSLASGVYVSSAGDWYTTREFRAQGVEEANPLMQPVVDNPAALAAVKVGAGSLVNYASYALKKGKRRYWAAPQIAWIVLNVAVSVHNHNQIND